MSDTPEINLPQIESENVDYTLQSVEAKSYVSKEIWTLIKDIAETIKLSEALPKALRGSTANVITVLLTGKEMGMLPMRAIKGLYPVNGIINIYGSETVRRLRDHGYTIEYIEEDEKHCKAKVYKLMLNPKYEGGTKITEPSEPMHIEDPHNTYIEDFKYDDALLSGYTGLIFNPETKLWEGDIKPGWMKGQNRKMKMRYGVLSAIIKSYIPEVLGSTADIQEIAEDYPTTSNNQIEETEKPRASLEARNKSLKNFIKDKDKDKKTKVKSIEDAETTEIRNLKPLETTTPSTVDTDTEVIPLNDRIKGKIA